jgi:mono/diheme cytochrome c family protein
LFPALLRAWYMFGSVVSSNTLRTSDSMSMRARGRLLVLLAALAALFATCRFPERAWAGAASLAQQLGLRSGAEIYRGACAACHGPDGHGTPQVTAGFTPPDTFPHFDKCDETTPEFTRDYTAVIRDGGPARGFSPIMPSFGAVLTADEINKVVRYLRSLCKETGWPLGELNVPRALVTEKAFPESETVVTTSGNVKGPASITNEVAYERILGKHDQLEIAVPFGWSHQPGGGLGAGLGDIAIADKHVLFSRLNAAPDAPLYESTGSIFSLQGEVALPTGNVSKGLGAGETVFGVFGAYDLLLPSQTFLQLQAGADFPLHVHETARSVFLHTAFGKTFSVDFGRQWSPMIELLGDRELSSGEVTDWDLLPEFQVTLNRRQHIRAAIGYRVPINATVGRPKQVVAYFLWDWFDGGLLEGW